MEELAIVQQPKACEKCGLATMDVCGVFGVLALDEALVSWRRGEATYFWSRTVQPGKNSNPAAHSSEIWCLLALDEELVIIDFSCSRRLRACLSQVFIVKRHGLALD